MPLLRIIAILALLASANSGLSETTKSASVFFSAEHRIRAAENVQRHDWAAAMQKKAIADAEPFMKTSDDELWSLMFGNTIKRSWMVWSNGPCPSCKKSVPMYTWKIDALKRPWKVQCPHCSEFFPRNDFAAYYKSGLDEHAVFDPVRADRALLVNQEHSNASDPLRTFGVDDGEGYVDGDKRWRFIGAYLIYGHWKQLIVGGAKKLSAAYAATGRPDYAHKAAILLDRVADLYPTFDFITQGILYDKPSPAAGYVSVWHDACLETRELVLAYDYIFDAIKSDESLIRFLSAKASQHKVLRTKLSFADVQTNIEAGLMRDVLANRPKIQSNFPYTDYTNAVIHTVLGWPATRDQVYQLLDETFRTATQVDGTTGEKGVPGYASYALRGVGEMLGQFNRVDPQFNERTVQKVPNLANTYRFHMDLWALQKYYPSSGDGGDFGAVYRDYKGLGLSRDPGVGPSDFSLMWSLHQLTGEPSYVQVMVGANGGNSSGLPYDLCTSDPKQLQKAVDQVISKAGVQLTQRSVNFRDWHLAMLRTGSGRNERITWLDYDAGGRHSHHDALNLGLYGYGIDLIPDFGYPPVQYGGWDAPRAQWYVSSAAHNSVLVNGKNHSDGAGATSLFADGKIIQAVSASAPACNGGELFERTVVTVNISESQFYVLDFFRISGGLRHQKFQHSHFGEFTTTGRTLNDAGDYLGNPQMRAWVQDTSTTGDGNWSIDFRIDDRMNARDTSDPLQLRYTDLTRNASHFLCEGWISYGGYNKNAEAWIPRVMTERKTTTGTLASTFVSTIEPYERSSAIASIRRTDAATSVVFGLESPVELEVTLADGRRDYVAFNPTGRSDTSASTGDAKLTLLRHDANGNSQSFVMSGGTTAKIHGRNIVFREPVQIAEFEFETAGLKLTTGNPGNLLSPQ